MEKEKLGTLKRVELKRIWQLEASDFSKWLSKEKNIALLSDTIGIIIDPDSLVMEDKVGDFRVDISGQEEGTDRKIIIENQLEDTNHDHLGKLITYASGKQASILIWIVKHAREEHKQATQRENTRFRQFAATNTPSKVLSAKKRSKSPINLPVSAKNRIFALYQPTELADNGK